MKKIIKIAFIAVFAAVAGYGIYTNQKSETMSDLMLANMDALAAGEDVEITCSRTCSDGVGRCYKLYDEYGNCHFSGYQSDNCTC